MSRWAWAEVDLGAMRHNVATAVAEVSPSAVWAVVKANGYGHGAVPAARAALGGGAAGLAVALVQEGVELREAGIGSPILVLSEQPPDELPAAVAHRLDLTVYSAAQVQQIAAAGGVDHPVHLKVDTGMHRVGAEPGSVLAVAQAIDGSPATRLAGVFTHLAVADEPDDPYTARQLDEFDNVLAGLAEAGLRPPLVHAANSAGGFAHAGARRSLVRLGIAAYGISPGSGVDHVPALGTLQPALSLHARVSHVQRLAAGERLSYGLRHRFGSDTTVATLPLGYADGVPRRLHSVGGEVLLGGRRRPIVGVVTMDQLMVDCGDDRVEVGDAAVLIGTQGGLTIRAEDWAERLGTIGYEVVCGISARIERRYIGA